MKESIHKSLINTVARLQEAPFPQGCRQGGVSLGATLPWTTAAIDMMGMLNLKPTPFFSFLSTSGFFKDSRD